jgi:hypothetical protein
VEVVGLAFRLLAAEVGPKYHDGLDVGEFECGLIELATEFFEASGVGTLSGAHTSTSRWGHRADPKARPGNARTPTTADGSSAGHDSTPARILPSGYCTARAN